MRAGSNAVHSNAATQQAATPQFSVTPGVYANTQNVAITDSTPGATIYYTTNGQYPSQYATPYTGAIPISSSEVVVAVAMAPGYSNSAWAVGRYIISSVPTSFLYSIAGNGSAGYSGDGAAAVAAQVSIQMPVAADSSGNVYFADVYNSVIRKVTAKTGVISTIAGNGTMGTSGDGGPATQAEIDDPTRLAVDSNGNVYEAESRGVIRVISASNGQISTYAGNPNGTSSTGPALDVKLGTSINGLAFDTSNNLYINISYSILKLTASTGMVSLVPQNSYSVWSGLAVDGGGLLYFADTTYGVIDQLNPVTGNITIVAGTKNPTIFNSGDGGPATSARLAATDLSFDSAGNMYILDSGDNAIREVHNGIINTIAGNWSSYSAGGDGDPATSVSLAVQYVGHFAVDPAGNTYITTFTPRVYKVTAPATPPTTVLPAPQFSVSAGTYAEPESVSVSSGNAGASIYLSTDGSTPKTGSSGYYGPVDVAGPMTLSAVASAPGYLPSQAASAKYNITAPPAAIISTVAGTGNVSFSPTPGPALTTSLGYLSAVVEDSAGNLFMVDTANHLVWELTASTGNLSIYAGSTTASSLGDGGPATSAQLMEPLSIALDSAENLYIADAGAGRIRKVTASTGIISTVAGGARPASGNGDGGPATSADLNAPSSIALDSSGNLYIAGGDYRVRMVSASTAIISTYAGTGTDGPMGDGGAASAASLSPAQIAFDQQGNLLIMDNLYARLRKVEAATGIITTVAGNGISGTSGNGGAALSASIANTAGLAVDKQGNIYLSEDPSQIRKIDATTGIIDGAVGTGYAGYSGDGGAALAASLNGAWNISFDGSGNLYIADSDNAVIRKVTFPAPAATPVFSLAAGAYTGGQSVTITDTTPNAAIYYTTDGTTPDTGSTKYTAPVAVGQTETIQAIAVASGYATSAVASAKYTITLLTPSVALTSSASTAFVSNPVTFTATLTSTGGTPTGSVDFYDGTLKLGTNTVNSSGVATFTTSSLASGTHSITAVYSGDMNFVSVTSAATTEMIVDFTLAPPSGGSTSATISPGGTATYTLAIAPPSGATFPAAVTFSVTGLPSGATATFNPASIAANAGSTNVTLSIAVPSSAAVRAANTAPTRTVPMALGLLLLPLLGVRKARRALSATFLLATLAIIGLAAVSGCGGGGSGSGTTTQPPQPQTYNLTVTATSGSLSHTTSLTLTVQ